MICSSFRSRLFFGGFLIFVLFTSRYNESSRISLSQNVVVRKKLFSDNRGDPVGGERGVSTVRPAQSLVPPKQIPMVSPLYPAGTAPVKGGLHSVHLANDGSAPLLDQTSSSFDSDCTDADEWARPRMAATAAVESGPVAQSSVGAAADASSQVARSPAECGAASRVPLLQNPTYYSCFIHLGSRSDAAANSPSPPGFR